MLIQSLLEHSKTLSGSAEASSSPAFSRVTVGFCLALSRGGATLLELPSGAVFEAASDCNRSSDTYPYRLVDNASYVLGVGTTDKVKERFDAFWACAEAVLAEAGLTLTGQLALVRAIRKDPALLDEAVADFKKLPKDRQGKALIALSSSRDPTPWIAHPDVRALIERQYADALAHGGFAAKKDEAKAAMKKSKPKKSVTSSKTTSCLLTGEPCVPARTHRSIGPFQAPLIAFGDKLAVVKEIDPATREVLAGAGDIFPVSPAAEAAYVDALKDIALHHQAQISPKPKDDSDAKIPVMSILSWGSSLDLTPLIAQNTGHEQRAPAWASLERHLESIETIHLVAVKLVKARIVILNYLQLRAAEVAKNLLSVREHFSTYSKDESRVVPSLSQLLGGDDVHPYTRIASVLAILQGQPLPRSFRALVLRRNIDSILREIAGRRDQNKDHGPNTHHWLEFMAQGRKNPDRSKEAMKNEPQLDDYIEGSDPEYLLGRLAAISHSVKIHAHNRDFENDLPKLAESSPARFIPEIARRFEIYRPKISHKSVGKKLLELWGDVYVAFGSSPLPTQRAPLSQEQRARFIIGLYQQSRFNTDYARYIKLRRAAAAAEAAT